MRIGIVMNGVTGRIGSRQHLLASIVGIRRDGGIPIERGDVIWPDPILVGRDADKLRALASAAGLERWGTDLSHCLEQRDDIMYFDSQRTAMRAAAVAQAIAAGKHVYCEKPLAENVATAMSLAKKAASLGLTTGVVQDKLLLPGLLKLKRLRDDGFFGRMLSVRGEFGYWVSDGADGQVGQRPSWNYVLEEGGGMALDMLSHWRYILDGVVAPVRSVSARAVTHMPTRCDELGRAFRATADDAAYALCELEGGIMAEISCSWARRVYRDDLLTLQIDGTEGSAIAGLSRCWTQSRAATPSYRWSVSSTERDSYRAGWSEVQGGERYENCYRAGWELFLTSLAADRPFTWDFLEGAKGVQLAEAALASSRERRWIDLPELSL